MAYRKQGVVEFGRGLFDSADLDPIYVALNTLDLDAYQLSKWLTAYWLFYSAGFASYAAEHGYREYWNLLAKAARNTDPTPFGGRWPRGAERRHFRGVVAEKAIALLSQRYSDPTGLLEYILEGPKDVRAVMGRVQEHYLFGSWIAFKVADMLDAVWGEPIDQTDVSVFLYETPRKSILTKWQEGILPIKATNEADVLVEAMHWLKGELSDCCIPHKPGQPPDWFTLETVWCKHASHLSGHYSLYKDIREITHGVGAWKKHSPIAAKFAAALPREPLMQFGAA